MSDPLCKRHNTFFQRYVSHSALCCIFQREYYATHQYFLSPRSLYLVMWSIIDGERGVEGLQQWLINIQVTKKTKKNSNTGACLTIFVLCFSHFARCKFYLWKKITSIKKTCIYKIMTCQGEKKEKDLVCDDNFLNYLLRTGK